MLRLFFVFVIAVGITLASIWSDQGAAQSADEGIVPELVVVDPPSRFVVQARRLGFSVSEPEKLKDLDMTVYRVRVPATSNASSIAALLRERFPGLIVDETAITKL